MTVRDMTVPRRGNRYNRLRDTSDQPLVENSHGINTSEGGGLSEECNNSAATTAPSSLDGNDFTVIVLDTLQNKFNVPASPSWTVLQFKNASEAVHHVIPISQRLVYMGRLLTDDMTLSSAQIEHGSIVHLFPKPNVIISGPNESDEQQVQETDPCNENGANTNSYGAHVPQIVLDIEEARRNHQSMSVLLTSTEMFEAQHRVKLLAFLLLIICSMELLTLVTILLGVPDAEDEQDIPPGDPTDAPFSPSSQMEIRTWKNSDYADLVISGFGFYVATLGIKATTDNTLAMAKKYYKGLIVTGIAWVAYYYYIDVDAARDQQQQNEDSNTDENNADTAPNAYPKENIYIDALYAILLPVVIWSMCFIRAWQFQTLIAQAEEEMQTRFDEIMGSSAARSGDADDGDSSANDLTLTEETRIPAIV